MKKLIKIQWISPLLFTVLALSSGCTEEISEEVINNEVISETESELAKYEDASIRVVSTSDSSLSHILHKQGSLSEACELDSPTLGFDSDDYDRTSSNYTVDCILDVQEHDLYWEGAELQVQVDEYLCEYVQYKPYRFLQFQPGITQKTQYEVECDSICSEEATLSPYCGNTYRSIGVIRNAATGAFDAGLSSSVLESTVNEDSLLFQLDTSDSNITTFFSNKVDSDEPLTCEFDYTEVEGYEAFNCDEGDITTIPVYINSIEVDNSSCSSSSYSDEASCVAAGETWNEVIEEVCDTSFSGSGDYPTIQVDETNAQTQDCGGEFEACLAGPSLEDLEADETSLIISNTDTSDFEYDISIPAAYDKGWNSNIYAANFSRVCSSTSLSKTNASFDSTVTEIIGEEVEEIPSRSFYTGYYNDDDGDGYLDSRALGKHMFNGVAHFYNSTYNVQPYYAINCLDKARDIKAQFRIFIRDWDRVFDDENAYITRLSDVNQSNALMDAVGSQVVGENWNDYRDIDDILADYDKDPETDFDGNGDNFENAFLNNQCTDLVYGHCYYRDTGTNETTCIGTTPTGSSFVGQFLTRWCVWDLDLYTDENTCETNGGTWMLEYCSDSQLLTQEACEAGGETWLDGNTLYPGYYL